MTKVKAQWYMTVTPGPRTCPTCFTEVEKGERMAWSMEEGWLCVACAAKRKLQCRYAKALREWKQRQKTMKMLGKPHAMPWEVQVPNAVDFEQAEKLIKKMREHRYRTTRTRPKRVMRG